MGGRLEHGKMQICAVRTEGKTVLTVIFPIKPEL